MSAAKTHYRLCKDFMNVAFAFYQLDNYVGGIDTTREVDPDDIDEIFSLTPPVLEAASNFTVSLGELMESVRRDRDAGEEHGGLPCHRRPALGGHR